MSLLRCITRHIFSPESFLQSLERNWKLIRDEGLAAMDETQGLFLPEDENLREKGDWSQFTLWQQGECLTSWSFCDLMGKGALLGVLHGAWETQMLKVWSSLLKMYAYSFMCVCMQVHSLMYAQVVFGCIMCLGFPGLSCYKEWSYCIDVTEKPTMGALERSFPGPPLPLSRGNTSQHESC